MKYDLTRIMYEPSSIPNVVRSHRVFMFKDEKGDERHYRIYLNFAELKFFINDEVKNEMVLKGTAGSRQCLIRKARKSLAKLNMQFNKETRKKEPIK